MRALVYFGKHLTGHQGSHGENKNRFPRGMEVNAGLAVVYSRSLIKGEIARDRLEGE